jgi:hypothetical protein
VECFRGWGKGEPNEARGWGPARAGEGGAGEEGPALWSVLGGGGRESPVKHGAWGASTSGGGGGQVGKDQAGGGGHGRGRTGQGELNGCIMHRVHTSKNNKSITKNA